MSDFSRMMMRRRFIRHQNQAIFGHCIASVSLGRLVCLAALIWMLVGCATPGFRDKVPGRLIEREQLVIHADFQVPRKHRLIDELVARRGDIVDALELPVSDEPIHVYLFEDGETFRKFVKREHPLFADRRALFVKDDTSLRIFAYWGDRVGEDLRHEVTHGYLHSVVPNVPLWLDEGIAEYFETPRGQHGFNSAHIFELANAFRRDEWTPDLHRLEELSRPEQMTQQDYAEAWLWVHFLIHSSEKNRKILTDQLARFRMAPDSGSLSEPLFSEMPEANEQLADHLLDLARQM